MLSILIPSRREKNINDFEDLVRQLFPRSEVIVSHDLFGAGKGWAIRHAFERSKGDVIAFLDGDGDIHPRMLFRLLPFLEDFDIVVGSKRIYKTRLSRKIITHLSRIFIRVMFGLNLDTQTGLKLFRRSTILPWKTNGFLFDCEILANAKRNKRSMVEVPIEANVTRTMKLAVLWKTFLESIILWFRLLFRVGR